ncbi:MAG: winged helix-turn-helix domain-containing protein [Methanophagales archaeon]|nr:winged helix-turn-helix domain-containing protein [Methanophagales archaeon]
MENGYIRGWQTKDVQILIKLKLGVSYGSKHVRWIISNWGFVRLVPRPLQ